MALLLFTLGAAPDFITSFHPNAGRHGTTLLLLPSQEALDPEKSGEKTWPGAVNRTYHHGGETERGAGPLPFLVSHDSKTELFDLNMNATDVNRKLLPTGMAPLRTDCTR